MAHTNDGSNPISFDDEWEERAAEQLSETEFDTDLGIALAKDAQRVVAGELSEHEFYKKHHDDVYEEFDGDERELEVTLGDAVAPDEDETDIATRISNAADSEAFRREFVKKGGMAAMGLSVLFGTDDGAISNDEGPVSSDEGVASTADATGTTGSTDGDDHTRWGMVINLDNCDGCLECVTACKGLHGTSRGAHWIYVMSYADPDQEHENFFVRTCMHCGNAPCEKVCPVGARHTREKDGLVLTDYDICIGCRYCMVSCPYGANYFQWSDPDTPRENENFTHDERGVWVDGPPPTGAMGKCTFEPAWQDGQEGEKLVGTTMCEMACQRDAIHFGDLNDPESDPNQHLKAYREENPNERSGFENRPPSTVSSFRAMEDRGTDPGVIFIGNEPSPHAEQVEGPVTYEDVGLVDNRKTEILDPTAADDSGGETS